MTGTESLKELAQQVAGGAAAVVADRALAGKQVTVGPVTLTPGAIGAGVLALALSFGVKLPAKRLLTNMVGGALVYEGTQLAQTQVVPLVDRFFPSLGLGGGAPALPTAGQDFVSGQIDPIDEQYGAGCDDWSLLASMDALRG